MSAHPVLSQYIKQSGGKTTIACMHREQPEQVTLLHAVAQLLCNNFTINPLALIGAGENEDCLPCVVHSNALDYPFNRTYCHKESSDYRAYRLTPRWQPLLGCPTPDPVHEIWASKVSVPLFPWVADHVVQRAIVFPGAGTLAVPSIILIHSNLILGRLC